MLTLVIFCFVIGYLLIVFEDPLRLDKTVPALLMSALCWAIISLGHLPVVNEIGGVITFQGVEKEVYYEGLTAVLLAHLSEIAEILLFLLGAMTIVELIDLHQGFSVITNRITTRSKRRLLALICIIAFFLSAVLDNLTTTIVMISLIRKLIPTPNDRLWFASLVVIAANAGGVWSPIGDVTTTMLWIGKKVSTGALIRNLYIPAIVSLLLPLTLVLLRKDFRGNFQNKLVSKEGLLSSRTLFFAGFGALLFVPVFKTITHLPPFVGMLFGLGITWLISEYVHPEENFQQENRRLYSVRRALSRIELSSILFFAGILLTIKSLESIAVFHPDGKAVSFLHQVAENLQAAIPSQEIVVILIGLLSAIIDNVPLVAAVMGMYTEPLDAELWHFIAFSAGTGGSILIIGSAAGVAAMGLEKIDFIWYFQRIAWLALLGFLAGCLTFIGWFALIN